MENQTVIKVENIGKKYNIAHQQGSYIALRDVITNVLKSPFSFIKQKAKKAVGLAKNEEFWALKNINFEVKKGEVVGIIGRNGAGKSTLLKILSQITPPTEGQIKIEGRVGSLLEVGTGFHPELSGRENIFLNGAILGMTRKEIAKKFDDIVSFAGIEKFLDTPVKHYSSGMYVRLAFSVAAHMDPDILIIDEVLAVGDSEFQKKCLGKMDEITKKEGRTILFVSHNLGAIQQLCKKTIVLKNGKIDCFDDTSSAIRKYIKGMSDGLNQGVDSRSFIGTLKNEVILNQVIINNEQDLATISPSSPIVIKISGEAKTNIEDFFVTASIFNNGARIMTALDVKNPKTLPVGQFTSTITIPANILRPGNYSLAVGGENDHGGWLFGEDVLHFNILEEWTDENKRINTGLANIPYKGIRE